MSVSALTWAFAQEIQPAPYKFVLVALADYANEEWQAYPSIAALEKKTCFERRFIFRALATLKRLGFIEPTGERKGTTKQIHVYRLKGCQPSNSLLKGDNQGTVTSVVSKGDKQVTLKGCHSGNTEPSVLLNRQEPSVPPIIPQGGNGQAHLSDTQKHLCRIFSRKLTTRWTDKELKSLKALGIIDPEDLDLIERYYEKERAKGKNGIQRRDIATFLNNFPSELDRATLALNSRQKRHDPFSGLSAEEKAMIGIYE